MSIKGFKVDGKTEKYDYNALDNLPDLSYIKDLKESVLLSENLAFSDIEDVDEYSQINQSASDYLSETTYSQEDTSYSTISQYKNIETNYRKDEPAPYIVEIPEQYVSTVHITDEETGKTYTVLTTEGVANIYNILPNHLHHYWIARSYNNAILGRGKIRPTGFLRMMYVPSVNNVRDIGGWSCDGGTIKYGLIYRGGELTGEHSVNITAADISVFRDIMGVKYEFDLRSDSETDMDEEPDITCSALGADIGYLRKSLQMYYDGINIYGSGWKNYKDIITAILETICEGKPVYIHCVSGADRTGGVLFLLEGLLGMSLNDVDKDYELTTFSNEDNMYRVRSDRNYRKMVDNFNDQIDGNTFMQKCVNWCDYVGIPIDLINKFRKVMINGTPSVVIATNEKYGSEYTIVSGFTVTAGVKRDSSTGQITETESSSYAASDYIAVNDNVLAKVSTGLATHHTNLNVSVYCYDENHTFLGSSVTLYTGQNDQYAYCRLIKNTAYVVLRAYYGSYNAEAAAFLDSLQLKLGKKVPPISCTGLSLDKTTATITDSDTLTIVATVSPSGCTEPIDWHTSDITIAGVVDGIITPSEQKGTVTISATCGEYEATCVVTIGEHASEWTSVTTAWTIGLKIDSSDLVTETENQENYAATAHISTSGYRKAKISNVYTTDRSLSANVHIYCYNSNKEKIQDITNITYGSTQESEVTLPSGTAFIRLRGYAVGATSSIREEYYTSTELQLGT